MAVIVYKCSVCDREIELIRNPAGLETVGRCTITDGCRGTLFQIDTKLDFIRGKFPKAVAGLTDWTQRQVLYNHTQSVASTQWIVSHNLGVNPSVQVYGERPSGDEVILVELVPDSIEIIDENNLLIKLPRAESGTAQCIGRSSRPVIDNVRVEEVVTEIEPFQISASSEFTIATIDTTTNIDLTISFTTPDGRVVDVVYTVDDTPAIDSPWSDTNKIYFHGKTYTTRSIDIISKIELTDGTVVDSSSFYIKYIDVGSGNRSLISEEVIILLANDPYEVLDKQVDKFVDPTLIGSDEASFSFYYENGEFFVYDDLIETVFPHIREI